MGLCIYVFHLLAIGRIQHPTAWMIGLLAVQAVFSVIIFACLYFFARDVASNIRELCH